MAFSETTRDRIRRGIWVTLHCLIIGSFVVAYTSIIRDIDAQSNLYLTMAAFTFLMISYVLGTVLMDRIARTMGDIAETVDSISDSVENISNSLPEEDP